MDRRRLGIVRLERMYQRGECLTSASSIVNWLTAMKLHYGSLGLVAPVLPFRAPGGTSQDEDRGAPWFCKRPADRVLKLPNVAGYARTVLLAPLVTFQLLRMRWSYGCVVCRVPEHGNWVILPLLALLRFRTAIWLVHDRALIEQAEQARRASSVRMRVGLVLSRLTGRVERHYLKKVPVIANGSRLAAWVRGLQSQNPRVLPVITTGLPGSEFPQLVTKTLEGDGPVEILYVGRIATDKGLGDLIEAFGTVVARASDRPLVLRVVGWSAHGEVERLREQVKRLRLGERVRFEGAIPFGPELFEYYRRAHLFVLPSRAEGTPRVLVEAMAFGLPIVATSVGGIPDLVENGRNGWLVPPEHATAIADAITKALNDPLTYRLMSRRNHEKARALSVEQLAARMAEFLDKELCRDGSARVPSGR